MADDGRSDGRRWMERSLRTQVECTELCTIPIIPSNERWRKQKQNIKSLFSIGEERASVERTSL